MRIKTVVFGMLLAGGVTAASAAQVVAWTSAETSFFGAYPNALVPAGKSTWAGNSLTLSFDRQPVDGASYGFSYSMASFMPSGVGPSLASSFVPVDAIGMSFDFSHTGTFEEYAALVFGYWNPSAPGAAQISNGVLPGVNYQFRTVVSPNEDWSQAYYCSHANLWSGSLDNGNRQCANDVSNSLTNGIDHVEVYFTQDMLTYLDGFINIGFQYVGTSKSMYANPDIVGGSASFANVSWLVSEGASANINRWHMPDVSNGTGNGAGTNGGATNSVPEPGSIALLGLALGGLAATRRKRVATN